MTFSIPTHKCGLVIGRGEWLLHRPHPSPHFPPALCSLSMASAGGENVKAINQQTGAFVEISRQLPTNGDPNFKLFIIRGSPQHLAKTRPGADCGSDHELFIAKFRLRENH